jgi:hypothetical protein
MSKEQIDPKTPRSICPGCGQRFSCGAENGEANCWCMEQASGTFEPSAGSSCYCPACLQQRIKREELARAT